MTEKQTIEESLDVTYDNCSAKAIAKVAKDVSRRDFIIKTISAGSAVIAVSGAALLSACTPRDGSSGLISEVSGSDEVQSLAVDASKVIKVQDFVAAPFGDYLQLQASYDLPLGSLAHQVDSSTVLILKPNDDNKNAREIAFLNINTGSLTTIVKKPLGSQKGVCIYDARASSTKLAWVEINFSDNSWCVYAVFLSGTTPGEALLLDEGNLDYEPPMLAVRGEKVYWTVMPMAQGKASQEDSYLRAIEFDPSKPAQSAKRYDVLVSHGRMTTNPLISEGSITVTPRVDAEAVYYQLTALDCTNDKLLERVIMPPSLRVSEAIYLKDRFAFSIERNYAYAQGLSSFGTYYQMETGEYLHFARTPMSPVLMFKDYLIIKSTASIVGVDYVNKKHFVIDLPQRCSSFGEALVGWGVQDKVVTSSIRLTEDSSATEAVVIRIFA